VQDIEGRVRRLRRAIGAQLYADAALDREIAAWETRYGVKAEPKDRTLAGKDYITFLNEYECTAEAVICR
jgi:hypothetical protein